jgi:hypothetical protein
MQRREIYGMIGVVFGLLGLYLLIIWLNDFLPFIRLSLAMLLLGIGVWATGVAAGVNWGNVFAPLQRALSRLPVATPSPVSSSFWLCPSCGRPVEERWRFCLHCGNPLSWETCPKCGQTQLAIGEFCGFCGAPLKGETQPTE